MSEIVVLLHGIGRTSKSLKALDKALSHAGYQTFLITYPSTKRNIAAIAEELEQSALSHLFWAKVDKVHFVTHSMGGLVARHYLDAYRDKIPQEKLGRVVMLAPPNGGSEVADWAHRLWPYQWFYGPAGQELTTSFQGAIRRKLYYDIGIIAGTIKWPYVDSWPVIPGPSDGRVSVESTKLKGMKDHISIPATHTLIMNKPDVHAQVLAFLKSGAFTRR